MIEKYQQSENVEIHQPSAKEELSKEGLEMGAGRGDTKVYVQK